MKLYRLTPSVFILLVFVTTVLLSACAGPDDKDIQKKASAALQGEPALKDVKVSVESGEVTLTGTCESANCDSLAEEKVKNIDGVKSIKNQVSNVMTDLTLRTSVQSIVSQYEGVQADVAGGVVVLRGSIEKKQVQPLINELQALKPKKLDNQLAIQ